MPDAAKSAGITQDIKVSLVISSCEDWNKTLPAEFENEASDCANSTELEAFLKTNDVFFRTETHQFVSGKYTHRSVTTTDDEKIDKIIKDWRYSLDQKLNQQLALEVAKKETSLGLFGINVLYNGALAPTKEYTLAKILNTVG